MARLNWVGPLTLEAATRTPVSKKGGIYLFAVEYLIKPAASNQPPSFLICWAGYTKSFGKRLQEHIRYHKKGLYYIFDASDLQRGKRTELWDWYYPKMDPVTKTVFEQRLPELKPKIDELLSTFRIFLAPLEVEARTLRRIEAAIMDILHSQSGPVRAVLGQEEKSQMNLSHRKPGEKKIKILSSSVGLMGLPESFEA